MKKKLEAILKYCRESDMLLLALCVISTIYGTILIYSTTRNQPGSNDVYIQVIALIIGISLYILFSLLDIDIIADKSKILYVLSIFFIATLFIWGEGEAGNRAWLRFGSVGIQPAEVVKIPFVVILAKLIMNFKERRTLNTFLSLLQILVVFGIMFVVIIVSSSDLGSALVYFFILIVMLFIGGLDLKWFLIGGAAFAAVSPLFWMQLSERQKARILAPFDSTIDPTGLGIMWQANQSKLAISAGNLFGEGLFTGPMTQSGAVPRQNTDFIFSVAGEELGLMGCLLIIALLLAIITRCIYVGIKSNNTLGLLVCLGLSAMLIAQMFENIGMCLGITPVIGLTLPFFSSGGSSILTMFAAMGIISGIKMRPKPMRFRSNER